MVVSHFNITKYTYTIYYMEWNVQTTKYYLKYHKYYTLAGLQD